MRTSGQPHPTPAHRSVPVGRPSALCLRKADRGTVTVLAIPDANFVEISDFSYKIERSGIQSGIVRNKRPWIPDRTLAPQKHTFLGSHTVWDDIMVQFYVYILASKRNGTLYIGMTNDLVRRVHEHKNNVVKGFTKTYSVHDLVYYEILDSAEQAIIREKKLKAWNRNWKIELIEKSNPTWQDLYDDIL